MGYSDEMAFRDCPWCGVRDAHFQLVSGPHTVRRANTTRRYWVTLACPRCASIVNLETTASGSQDRVLTTVPNEPRSSDVEDLPEDVAEYYSQAQRALDAELPDAAAVALRRTLEAAASHFGHDENVLVQRIEGLIAEGLITKPFGEVLHQVRRIGNIGAHASDARVSSAVAAQILSFTTQMLRNLFEIPSALNRLTAAEAGVEQQAQ